MILVILTQFFPPEMAMSGYVSGDLRLYALGGAHSGYEIDSVIGVDNTTRIGCILPVTGRIVTIKSWNPDSSRVDTFYAYYNTFYLVEFFEKPYFGLKANLPDIRIALRTLKFPIVPGDRWPAYDWCGAQPGDYYYAGDLDGNGLTDSVVFFPSEMRYTYVAPDTDTVVTAGVVEYVLLYSFWDTLRSLGDTAFWILHKRGFHHYDYIHFLYVKGVGYVEYEVDSSKVDYYSYIYIINGSHVSSLLSLDSVKTSYSLYSRTRRPLSVSEVRDRGRFSLRVNGGRVYIRCDGCSYRVYGPGGRIVKAGAVDGEVSVSLKAGVYFVRVAGETERVVVR